MLTILIAFCLFLAPSQEARWDHRFVGRDFVPASFFIRQKSREEGRLWGKERLESFYPWILSARFHWNLKLWGITGTVWDFYLLKTSLTVSSPYVFFCVGVEDIGKDLSLLIITNWWPNWLSALICPAQRSEVSSLIELFQNQKP